MLELRIAYANAVKIGRLIISIPEKLEKLLQINNNPAANKHVDINKKALNHRKIREQANTN